MAEPQYVTMEEFEHHFNLLKDANIMAMRCLVTALAMQLDASLLRQSLETTVKNLKISSHPQMGDLIKIIVEELAVGAGQIEAMKASMLKGNDSRN